MAEGVEFKSDTDTEIIVQLVEKYLAVEKDFVKQSDSTLLELKGAHGIVVLYLYRTR